MRRRKNYHIGLLLYRYPDAWLPRDAKHFISCASPETFKTIKIVDGRENTMYGLCVVGKSTSIELHPFPNGSR